MKKTVITILLFYAMHLHAQLSGIDFSGINAPKNANTSGSTLLNGDILYDFTDKGDFFFTNDDDKIFSYYIANKDNIGTIYFSTSKKGRPIGFQIYTNDYYKYKSGRYFKVKNATLTVLDQNEIDEFKRTKEIYYTVPYMKGFCEKPDAETTEFWYNWLFNGGIHKYSLSSYTSILSFETEKTLRGFTSGKVSRINLKSFNIDAVLFDYIMNPDKEGNITLNILGSDGKKITSYNINRDELRKEASPEKYLSAGIQKLTDMFLKDAAAIAKINNQKETMQNTYRNDEERTQQLMYELQYYQKERANR